MEKYKNLIKMGILLGMKIIPEGEKVIEDDGEDINLKQIKAKILERLEDQIAKKLSGTQLISFSYLFHCYSYAEAARIISKEVQIISISAIYKSSKRASDRVVKLALKDDLIQEWGRKWRESQKYLKQS